MTSRGCGGFCHRGAEKQEELIVGVVRIVDVSLFLLFGRSRVGGGVCLLLVCFVVFWGLVVSWKRMVLDVCLVVFCLFLWCSWWFWG